MPYPFPNLRRSETDFAEAKQYWRQLVDSVAAEIPGSGQWVDWLEQRFADGSPYDLEFRNVLVARSDVMHRALRIHQEPRDSAEASVGTWFKDLSDFEGIPDGVVELNVHVAPLSDRAADIVRGLLREWLDPSGSVESVRALASQF